MKKQTVLRNIDFATDGTLQVRFAKQLLDDDGSLLSSEWHRTAFAPGQDIAAQMGAVNAHLAGMDCEPVNASALAQIEAVATVAWTEEVIAAYRQAAEVET